MQAGSLKDDQSTGLVTLNQVPECMQSIARADVAKVAVACHEDDHSIGKTLELYQGNIGFKDAIKPLKKVLSLKIKSTNTPGDVLCLMKIN